MKISQKKNAALQQLQEPSPLSQTPIALLTSDTHLPLMSSKGGKLRLRRMLGGDILKPELS